MGVLNVTPDSFSDGFPDAGAAIAHGLDLLAQGADLLDVGGESTRPGAARVDADEELRRVRPVVRALAEAGAVVSIDTTRATVAEAALAEGATIVNDVSGGLADPSLVKVVAATGAPYVLMHSRGPANAPAVYADVVAEVCDELTRRLDDAVAAGVDPANVILDPGLGFAKNAGHNLALLRALPRLVALGPRLLVGASRKSFLGQVLGGRDVTGRDDATQAVTTLAAWHGAWGVRVHAVRPAADAVRVVEAVRG
ncbi:MAG TPA: dihydropteroate synthase [Mycobacteriales bacterium]|jgi:dihydropteroate synthase|nr:dihydropteroate synthase [Mycobacteriales bacterium]